MFRQGFSVAVFFSQAWYLYHKKVVSWHTSSEMLSFLHGWGLIIVWICYRCQSRIENYYHHDGEQLRFYKKAHMKTQGKKKDVLVTLYC